MTHTIVIKIGSSVIFTKRGKLDKFRLFHFARQLKILKENSVGVILVISGAVAMGNSVCHLPEMKSRQALSGVGQAYLITELVNIFRSQVIQIAQILLTQNYFDKYDNKSNLKGILDFYLAQNILPVINENDVLDLNSFGGNDLLAVEIARIVKAKKLLILSTMNGSSFGIGGRKTKIQSLELLSKYKIDAEIADGKKKNIILNSI